MTILLNPRLWIALAVAILLGWAGIHLYRAGEASVQQKWDHQISKDKEAALEATQENQRIAARWNAQTIGAINDAKNREMGLRADAANARDALQRLRNAVRTASSPVSSNPGNAVSGPSSTGQLLLECGEAYQQLAAAADQHASDVKTLTSAWPK